MKHLLIALFLLYCSSFIASGADAKAPKWMSEVTDPVLKAKMIAQNIAATSGAAEAAGHGFVGENLAAMIRAVVEGKTIMDGPFKGATFRSSGVSEQDQARAAKYLELKSGVLSYKDDSVASILVRDPKIDARAIAVMSAVAHAAGHDFSTQSLKEIVRAIVEGVAMNEGLSKGLTFQIPGLSEKDQAKVAKYLRLSDGCLVYTEGED